MKMYQGIVFIIIVAAVVIFSAVYFSGRISVPPTVQNPQNQVCFGKNCFFVELAKTNAERDTGLMNRTSLDKDKGMLFIFDSEGIYPFWMKNTLIPLDMIWIKENPSAGSGQVVFIAQNVQPCKTLLCPSVIPQGSAKYVLELNAGTSDKIGLKVGDSAELNIK